MNCRGVNAKWQGVTAEARRWHCEMERRQCGVEMSYCETTKVSLRSGELYCEVDKGVTAKCRGVNVKWGGVTT